MDAQQFAYWLQGFAELSGETPPTPEQWNMIRAHLQLLFKKVTPQFNLKELAVQFDRPWQKPAPSSKLDVIC